MDRSRTLFLILVFLVITLVKTSPSTAQATFPLSNFQAVSSFGTSIVFSADIEAETDFEAIDLIFKSRSTGKSIVIPASLVSGSQVVAEYQFQPQDYIPVFSTIEYWYIIKFPDGSQRQSQIERFVYEDTRYTWLHLESSDSYEIYWTEGDLAFGQAIQDAIYQSINNFSEILELPVPDTLSLYIYPNNSALQSALSITNARWVAGHANPAENTIIASIPTGTEEILDIKRTIPHELTHIRLYYYLESSYASLPAWFNEGLATLSELYFLPEYRETLDAAWNNDKLIPLNELCSAFPIEADRAKLAYAQAVSFVRFLYDNYGREGLQRLLDNYKQGHTCENGLQQAFNFQQDTIERQWYQATFNSTILPQSVNSALTWIVLLIFLVATPLGMSLLRTRRK